MKSPFNWCIVITGPVISLEFHEHNGTVELHSHEQFCNKYIFLCFSFRGGLDILNNDTGETSVYEKYEESEIMFHVSTLLPKSNRDGQHIEKKRHIGNDRVAIVFQDENTVTFIPFLFWS